MADIQTLENPEVSPSPSPSPSAAPDDNSSRITEQSVPNPVLTGLHKLTDAYNKTDKAALLIGVVIVGQLLIIYQLVYPAIQITKETYQEYTRTIREFNDKKYANLEDRVKKLEEQNYNYNSLILSTKNIPSESPK